MYRGLGIAVGFFAALTAVCAVAYWANQGYQERVTQHTASGEVVVAITYKGPYPIKAECTTGMVADLVEHVGGRYVKVTHLMGAGVDPHLYKVSPGDVHRLNAADMVFYSGLHLEGKMGDVFKRMEKRRPTFPVADKINESQVLTNAQGNHDPHLWFDVKLWSMGLEVVSDVLSKYDPPHAAEYKANATEYHKQLLALHEEIKRTLAEIPRERRVMVTAHDAFQYFGRAYDIEVRGIQGISTESEAGVREINELVNFITQRKIKAVFVESSVSERNMRALIEGCRARGHEVQIGGQLYSDAMGTEGTPDGTYEGMIRHNVETIAATLH